MIPAFDSPANPTSGAKVIRGARGYVRGAICTGATLAISVALGVGSAPAPAVAREGVRVVVIDAGHGGDDYGAIGVDGALEKDLALAFSRRLGKELEKAGVRVVYTRSDDSFVSLASRTSMANYSGAELFLSVHANYSRNPDVRGPETYFMSLEASDGDALDVAVAENRVFRRDGVAADSGDRVGAILGDLIRTDHMRLSSRVAREIQRELADLPGPSRGVRQGKFVVLAGVNMPSVLIELGFLSNPRDAEMLTQDEHLKRLAEAITRAVKGLRIVDREPRRDADARAQEAGS